MGNLKAIVVTLIIFSGVVIGVSGFYGSLGLRYGVNTTDMGFLNRSTAVASTLSDLESKIKQPTNPLEIAAFIAFGALDTAKLTFQSADTLTGIVGDISDPDNIGGALAIPAWVSTVLIGLIIVIVIFAILSAWARYDM